MVVLDEWRYIFNIFNGAAFIVESDRVLCVSVSDLALRVDNVGVFLAPLCERRAVNSCGRRGARWPNMLREAHPAMQCY